MKEHKYTWRQLKEFCNNLPDEFMDDNVIWWGEETGGKLFAAYQLTEDYTTTDYGCEPISEQDPPEEGEEPWEVTHPKGTPIISVD